MQFGQSNWVKSDLGRNRPTTISFWREARRIPMKSSDRAAGRLGGLGGQVAWTALSETKTKTSNQ